MDPETKEEIKQVKLGEKRKPERPVKELEQKS